MITMSHDDALGQLKEGNSRYAGGSGRNFSNLSEARDSLVEGQRPFAVVLGCSDSRVPPEIVFDQGLGDLFVVRVAGNVAGPTQVGSIEFAVAEFGSPLVVVIGHAGCGAVRATLRSLSKKGAASPSAEVSDDLLAITTLIEPVLLPLHGKPEEEAMAVGVTANVRASVARLAERSALLRDRISAGHLAVVGAEYCLRSGQVTFIEEPGRSARR